MSQGLLYKWRTVLAEYHRKQAIPHCMRRHFRQNCPGPSGSHTVLARRIVVQRGLQTMHNSRLNSGVVFLQRNAWLWTRSCPGIFWVSPSSSNGDLLACLGCRAENEQHYSNQRLGLRACCNVLTRRDGQSKLSNFKPSRPCKSLATAWCPLAVWK